MNRVWALLNGDSTLAFYTSTDGWQAYGPGWSVDFLSNPEDDIQGMVVDERGGVWIAHGRNGLHQFDPAAGQWTTLRAAEVGYVPPPTSNDDYMRYDPHLSFNGIGLDDFGNVWTAACSLRLFEDGPYLKMMGDGDGARWFDGKTWAGPAETTARCIWDIDVDDQGKVWLAGPKNDLWTGEYDYIRFDGDDGSWQRLPVPTDEMYRDRPRFVGSVQFDTLGKPWIWVETRGGASFPQPVPYYQDGDRWVKLLDELIGHIYFGPDGEVWLYVYDAFQEGEGWLQGLFRYQDGRLDLGPISLAEINDLVNGETMVADGYGRLWFMGKDEVTLWYYQP